MNRFFGYIRVSTVKQGEHGVSLQEQKSGIERYAAKNGFEIVAWFEERETAAKVGRPVFNEMMRRLRKKEADGVIIHKIDRSARNFKDWTAIEELADRGISVHFVNESLDLRTTGGRLAADMQAVVAAHYVRNLREETKKGFYGRLKQGLFPLRAPVGYLDKGGGKPKEIDPLQGPLIRKAFVYATGKYTLATLREEMSRLGFRNRNGKPFSLDGFSGFLNNPFYIGLIRLKKTGETFEGVHEPLIGTSLFDRVRGVLQGRTKLCVRGRRFILQRLLRCRVCGYSLVGEQQKKIYVYYRCQTKGCPTRSVRENAVLEEIGARVVQPLQLVPEELSEARETLEELRKNWAKDHASQREALKMSLGQVASRLGRLTDAFLDGTIEKDLFEERKTALLEERKRLEEAMRELDTDPARGITRTEEFLELCASAQMLYESAIGQEKRDLVALLTSNRLVEGKKLHFIWAPPFSLIAKREPVSSSSPQRDEPRTWNTLLASLVHGFVNILE